MVFMSSSPAIRVVWSRLLLGGLMAATPFAASACTSAPPGDSPADPGALHDPKTTGTAKPGTPGIPAPSAGGQPGGGPSGEPGVTTSPGIAPGAASGAFDPGVPVFRRLTNAQYANVVRTALGLPGDADAALGSDRSLEGFANGEHQAAPSSALIKSYSDAAFGLATAATAVAARPQLFDAGTCGDVTVCLTKFVKVMGRRLFRRPLRDDELAAVIKGAGEEAKLAGDFWAGARFSIEVMLQSVPFLYLVDSGVNDSNPALLRRDPFSVATRLSLLLWNSGPDDEVLDLAEKGGLRTSADLAAVVPRMLEKPAALAAFRHFFREWLSYDFAALASKDPTHLDFKAPLTRSLIDETDRLVDHTLVTKAPVLGLFDADTSFADAAVRKFYGATENLPTDPSRVRLPKERRGVLSHGSFIASHSGFGLPSPTLRGLAVLERFLCSDVPDPPPDAPAELPEPADKSPRTIRERTEVAMLANPKCSYCHTHMDQIGFLFENFDVIGKFRTTEPVKGAPGGTKPVNATGAIPLLMMDKVDGLPGLGKVLASHDLARTCLIKTIVRYGLGRQEDKGDDRLIGILSDAYRAGNGAFPALMQALAQSENTLVMRRPQ